MSIIVEKNLPAIETLAKENIFVITKDRAETQDMRELKIIVLNLMPIKITTETDLIRVLSNSPIQVELTLLKLSSYNSTHTAAAHMEAFYKEFDEIKDKKYDGMIITGAPLENYHYTEVSSWPEISKILDWSRTHCWSTMYICWGALAALFHFYGIDKKMTEHKVFGVFEHKMLNPLNPIFRGFDDKFFVPHSRHCEILRDDVLRVPELSLLAESDETGPYMMMARGGREIFVTGHLEYNPYTLDTEYKRDLEKGLPIDIPKNYYKDDDPAKGPEVRWRSAASLFFQNWINYFVYQQTPFDINQIQ